MDRTLLDGLFKPKSIAVIGASAKPGKIGYTVVKNLLQDKFEGSIYPINPDGGEIQGLKCYPSILDVPGPVDAAAITIPAKIVAQALEECGKKGVKGLIVITSGFSEIGRNDLEEEIVQIAHKHKMCILGPNIVGLLSNSGKMNASFAPYLPLPGKGSLVSQSGALLIAIDAATYLRRIGFDKLISIGNMSDVDIADTIEWLNDDENTACITLYIEGLKDGRRFMEVSRKARKPILALKAGVSAHGAAAAASHTGSLAGAAKVYGAAFQQSGIVEVSDLDNLFDRSLALSLQPPMKGDNMLIITNGGGVGVLATDAAEKYGIPLKFAPSDVQVEMKTHMPDFGSAKNPVDLTGMAGCDWYHTTTKFSYAHPWVDGLVLLYCETSLTDPVDIAKSIEQGIKDSGVEGKPIIVSFIGGEKSLNGIRYLVEHGIPAYTAPDIAINAMAALREYARIKEILAEPAEALNGVDRQAAINTINQVRADGRNTLTEIEAKEVFAAYGLPITPTSLARTEEDALRIAREFGFPVVMKIVSPDILHKSDAGGVKVNIRSEEGVKEAYAAILKNAKAYKADAKIHGIAVQEMAPFGTEVILGSINDGTFGPTMMFGLGGIFVEVLKDVTFRVAPVSISQAKRMIGEIRGAPILSGVRGEKPRDRRALAETVSRYSMMIIDLANEISESDANPVLVYEEGRGIKVVDARIILKKK